MNKEAEKKRLAKEVFEGADDDVTCASMGLSGIWMCFDLEPVLTETKWFFDPYRTNWHVAKNQPETELPWQETLLERKDYE